MNARRPPAHAPLAGAVLARHAAGARASLLRTPR